MQDVILLVRKPEETSWGFPGGFADPTDANFEAAALRELTEECGPLQLGALQYRGSFQVEDWRYRREQHKIFTLLYSTTYLSGTPAAGDDVEEVRWFSLQQLPQLMEEKLIRPAHLPMLKHLLTQLPADALLA